jgi:hypothetical protein
MEMEIFYLHTPKTLSLTGKKAVTWLNACAPVPMFLEKLIDVFEVILSARSVVHIVRFLVRRVSRLIYRSTEIVT